MEGARIARVAGGIAVLLLMAGLGIALVPPYVENWRLQRYVNELIEDPATATLPPDVIKTRLASRAVALGLPMHSDDVKVTPSGSAIRIEALYLVHIDVAGYAVDLHFRPAAGGN